MNKLIPRVPDLQLGYQNQRNDLSFQHCPWLLPAGGLPRRWLTENSSVHVSTPARQVDEDGTVGMVKTLCPNIGKMRMEQLPLSFLKHSWCSSSNQEQLCHPEAFQSPWPVLGIFPESCSCQGFAEAGNMLSTLGLMSRWASVGG